MSTGASKGLQKALARAGSSVVAIAEMQAADLLAEMTDEQKAELSASLAPAASTAPAAAADDKGGEEKPGKKDGEEEEPAADASAQAQAGDPRVKAVAKAVAEDENCKGKAALALAMLADDDYTGLSASGIVKLLGKQPAPEASASGDPEAAARAEMRDAIAEGAANSNIDPNAGGKGTDKAGQSAAVWDSAIAQVFPNSKGA